MSTSRPSGLSGVQGWVPVRTSWIQSVGISVGTSRVDPLPPTSSGLSQWLPVSQADQQAAGGGPTGRCGTPITFKRESLLPSDHPSLNALDQPSGHPASDLSHPHYLGLQARTTTPVDFYVVLHVFRRWSFTLVAQGGVQWRDLGSPQPPPPRFK
ncbi:uncharacterized protein LOC129057178 isoform X2 [Pongo abelii]|uniref:uncharacterized protein LOC129057178 isoform X2 n=1 Tax=Pongo abelii TaxID=9601 RepID=UPI0030043772